jgi:MFS family permease
VAGLLVAGAVGVAFGVSAGLWALAIVALLAIRGGYRPVRIGPPATLRADVREGLSYLLGHRVLRTMALMVGVGNLASSATFAVLVVHAVGPDSALGLSEPGFGLLLATFAVGALVGGLVAERLQQRLGRARSLTASVVGMASSSVALALTTSVAVVATAAIFSGLTVMLWNVATVSFRQRVTPDHLLGRLNSAYRLLAWGTRPLGAALGGLLGQWFGTRAVFGVMGALALGLLVPDRTLTEQALADAEKRADVERHATTAAPC